jgi:pimeloyl-ACP methyl ester carboxylesterase
MDRYVRLALAVVLGLLIGVAVDVARTGSWLDWLARHSLIGPYDPVGRQVDIGSRSLYLDCRGSGSPTVVLEAGMGGGAAGWGSVLPSIAERTRVCAYDRAGLGRSEPRGRHSAADVAMDLKALLDAAGERPPFLVVGHSLGGVYGRIFADRQQDDVVGIVLVDAFNPDLWGRLVEVMPPDKAPEWRDFLEPTFDLVERTEDLDWDTSAAELAATSVVGLPIEVVVVRQTFDGIPDLEPATVDAMYAAWRAGLESLSDDVRITVLTDSGHLVQLDKPSAIVEAVDRLLARGSSGSS